MNKRFWGRVGYLWILGLALFAVRLLQLRTGFDPDTGLAVPTIYGSVLAKGIVVWMIAEAVRCLLRVPRTKAGFYEAFETPVKSVPLLAAGSVLLAAGGVLMVLQALPVRGVAAMAAGVLAVAAGGGLVLLTRQIRQGEPLTAFPLLPAMFFSVFFLLAIYLPAESDPVLSRFYIPVLAAALAAVAFSMLASFLRREGSLRAFVCAGDMAVFLCLTAAADGVGSPEKMLLFVGCALVLSVFLFLRRDRAAEETPVEVPEAAAGENAPGGEAEA